MSKFESGGRRTGMLLCVMASLPVAALFSRAGQPSAGAEGTPAEARRAMPVVRDYLARLGMLDQAMAVTIESRAIPHGKNVERKLWVADCVDTDDRYVAHLTIDASTGVLVDASKRHFAPRTPGLRPMSRRMAIQQAAAIAAWCAPMAGGEQLRLSEQPARHGDVWCVALRSRTRATSIMMDSRTGGVVLVTHRKLRPAEMRLASGV